MSRHSAADFMYPPVQTHWYLVANRVGAAIYEGRPGHGFRFVSRMIHRRGKRLDSELESDRPGRGIASSRGSRIHHGLNGESSRHEQVAERFAAKIGKLLEAAGREGKYTDLVVVAEPHFLGLIRGHLPEQVKKRVVAEIPREFAQGSDEELETYLRKKLA